MFREQRIALGEVALHYAEGPDAGPPFVLLHGGSARWQYGERLLRTLAERWHVYAPDLRGHGRSDRAMGRYRLRDYADDVVAFLDRVVSEPSVLYGHSLGGEVAVVVAARAPNLIRAVVVGDSPLFPETSPTRSPAHLAMAEAWRELAASSRSATEIASALRESPVGVAGSETPVRAVDALGEDNPWFAFMGETLSLLDAETLATILDPVAMFAGYDAEAVLRAIECPVLLLQADPAASPMLSDHDAEHARRLLRRSSLTRLDGVGHPLHGTHPEAVYQAIEAFLTAQSIALGG